MDIHVRTSTHGHRDKQGNTKTTVVLPGRLWVIFTQSTGADYYRSPLMIEGASVWVELHYSTQTQETGVLFCSSVGQTDEPGDGLWA